MWTLAIARDQLLQIAVSLQGEVIRSLQIAVAVENAILDLTRLHEAAVTKRYDTIRALDELKQRILVSLPLGSPVGSTPTDSDSTRSGSFAGYMLQNAALPFSLDMLPAAVTIEGQERQERQGLGRYLSSKSASRRSSSPAPSRVSIAPSFAWLSPMIRGPGTEDDSRTIGRASVQLEDDGEIASLRSSKHDSVTGTKTPVRMSSAATKSSSGAGSDLYGSSGSDRYSMTTQRANVEVRSDAASISPSETRPATATRSKSDTASEVNKTTAVMKRRDPPARTNSLTAPELANMRISEEAAAPLSEDGPRARPEKVSPGSDSVYSDGPPDMSYFPPQTPTTSEAAASSPMSPQTRFSGRIVSPSHTTEASRRSYLAQFAPQAQSPRPSTSSAATAAASAPPSPAGVHPALREIQPQSTTLSQSTPVQRTPSTHLTRGRPHKDNNYWGFCKGSWNVRESVKSGLSLHMVPTGVYGRSPYWKCRSCEFRTPAVGPFKALPTRVLSASCGISYKWLFLAKSHVRCSSAVAGADEYSYGCAFCSVEGRETGVYGDVDTLMSHIDMRHVGAMTEEVMRRTKCVVGRQPERGEDWDICVLGHGPGGNGGLPVEMPS